MRTKLTLQTISICCLVVQFAIGPRCHAGEKAEKVGKGMDTAERYLEEYGSISISVPLMTKLGENFNFDLNRGASNYFSDAKTQVQGAAAAFQQTVQSLSISAQAQFDPTVAAAYAAQLQNYFGSLQRYHTRQNLMDQAAFEQLQANMASANTNKDPTAKYFATAQALQAYGQQYAAPTNPPVYPTADQSNTNLPSLGTLPGRPSVTNVLSAQQFLPFQGLLSGLNLQPTISDRAALLQTAGDVATESIFRHFMGSTNFSSETAEDNVFFGFSTVSVNPGWRTKQGWLAEAIMTAEVGYTTSRLEIVKRVFQAETNPVIRAQLYLSYGETFGLMDPHARQIALDYMAATNATPKGKSPVTFLNYLSSIEGAGSLGIQTNVIDSEGLVSDMFQASTGLPPSSSAAADYVLTSLNGKDIRSELDSLQEALTKTPSPEFTYTNINLFFSNAEAAFKEPANAPQEADTNAAYFGSWLHQQVEDQPALADASQAYPRETFRLLTNLVSPIPKLASVPSTNWSQFPFAKALPGIKPIPVTIISPLVDADVEDFSSSSRSQTEFALALSFALRYAGLNAQANAFEQFVKNQQFDIRTRNALTAVNAFSGADGKFGFQVGPRLQALDNPTKQVAKSSQLLDRQAFPALLLLRLGQVDLKPVLLSRDDYGQLTVFEPQLRFTQMRRWAPLAHAFARDAAFYRWFMPVYWANPPISETKRVKAASQLYKAQNNLRCVPLSETASNAISKRIDNLEAQIVGAQGSALLDANDIVPTNNPPAVVKPPAVAFASVTNIVPSEVVIGSSNANLTFAFFGTGLEQVDTNNFTISEIPTNIFSTNGISLKLQSLKGSALLLQDFSMELNASEPGTNDVALVFRLQTTNSATRQFIYAPPVTVKVVRPVVTANAPTVKNAPTVSFTLSSNLISGASSITYTLSTTTNATDAHISAAMNLIKADIEKNKAEAGRSSNTVFSMLVNENQTTGSTNGVAPPRKTSVRLEQ